MSPGRRLCFGLWSGEEFLSDKTGMVYFCSVSSVVLLFKESLGTRAMAGCFQG